MISLRFPRFPFVSPTALTGLMIAAVLTAGVPTAKPAFADSVVVPPGLAAVEGNRTFGILTALTFQQLYGTPLLTGLNAGDQITGISFRLNDNQLSPDVASFANFDLYLGTSNFAPGSLTSNRQANQGADTIQVRGGALSLAAGSFPAGASPNAFGPVITFSSAYTYTGGDLLLTVSYTDPSRFFVLDGDDSAASTGSQEVQGMGYNNSVLTSSSTPYVLVSQFQVVRGVAAAAPEPSTLPLVGMGIVTSAGMVGRVRRRKVKKQAA